MLNKLAREILEINQANGWSVTQPSDMDDSPYKIPAILALIHSEISEAWEAFHGADRDNFGEELADVIIRILDMLGGLGVDIEAQVSFGRDQIPPMESLNQIGAWRTTEIASAGAAAKPSDGIEFLLFLHGQTSACLECFRKNMEVDFFWEATMLLLNTLGFADLARIDMDREVALKLEKNKGRGYRHGGKRV